VGNLENYTHHLALYFGSSLSDAENTTLSSMERFFEGDAYKGWIKEREAKAKFNNLLLGRIDNLTKAVSSRR
jgi:hypothetical protein